MTTDLIHQASLGCSAAQATLAERAVSAGRSGAVRPIEGLIAAETWARMAAAGGDAASERYLAEVLLLRSQFDAERGMAGRSRWREGEARRRLRRLADAGDHQAAAKLNDLAEDAEAEAFGEDPEPEMAACLAGAAKGDLKALSRLYDDAFQRWSAGQVDPVETLTVAELYARIGIESGDADQFRRLVDVLLRRGDFEWREGRPARTESAAHEAIVLLSILADTGDWNMAAVLGDVAAVAPRASLVKAANDRPSVLLHVKTWGAC